MRAPTLRLDDVTADEVCMSPHTCTITLSEYHSCVTETILHVMSFYWQDLVTPPPRTRDLDEKATGTPPAIVTPYAKTQLAAFKRAQAASKNVLWQHVKR